MAKQAAGKSSGGASVPASRLKPSSLLDTRVVYFAICSHKIIVTLTVQKILDEHIAKKLV
ncbi:MAG TPA: hypothetical protein VKA67_06315 [Verrucomicrobiae bacterium]|nr:hypothetical protein [Verrucomicrobiae bacterium]